MWSPLPSQEYAHPMPLPSLIRPVADGMTSYNNAQQQRAQKGVAA